MTGLIMIVIGLSLFAIAATLAMGALSKRSIAHEKTIKTLSERLLLSELCISQMAGLHATQAKVIKDFADATPLIKQMSEIMAVEIEKRKAGGSSH